MTNKKIAVIIPFYQKEEGILRKAVLSALDQKDADNYKIIVVDDSSPISAAKELQQLLAAHPDKIEIIKKHGGGPGASRNIGLESIPGDTEYAAFLDSDDTWTEDHLKNALAALEMGYDFYFTDHFQLNQTISAFNRAKRVDLKDHKMLSGEGVLYEYRGDMFDQILRGNIIGTSTVVYRYRKFPDVRFLDFYACEDYLFWLNLSVLTDKIAFSSKCEATYGSGVNIWVGSGWGAGRSLLRAHNEMKYRKTVAKLYKLNRIQKTDNNVKIRKIRENFVGEILHAVTHKNNVDKNILMAQFKVDPLTFIYFIPITIAIFFERLQKHGAG